MLLPCLTLKPCPILTPWPTLTQKLIRWGALEAAIGAATVEEEGTAEEDLAVVALEVDLVEAASVVDLAEVEATEAAGTTAKGVGEGVGYVDATPNETNKRI